MNFLLRLIVLLFVSLACVGCSSTVQYRSFPDQLKAVEDPDKGRIYVVRPAAIFGSAVGMDVLEDGKWVGTTTGAAYLCWEREPGKTVITSKAENQWDIEIQVVKGTVLYILQRVETGVWFARTALEIIPEATGKKYLQKCHPPQVLSTPH